MISEQFINQNASFFRSVVRDKRDPIRLPLEGDLGQTGSIRRAGEQTIRLSRPEFNLRPVPAKQPLCRSLIFENGKGGIAENGAVAFQIRQMHEQDPSALLQGTAVKRGGEERRCGGDGSW